MTVAGIVRHQSSNITLNYVDSNVSYIGTEGNSRLSTTASNVENKMLIPYILNMSENSSNSRQ